MERTDALDLKEFANEFTVIETSGTDVSLGSFNPECPVQNLRVRLSSNYVEFNKNYAFKKEKMSFTF